MSTRAALRVGRASILLGVLVIALLWALRSELLRGSGVEREAELVALGPAPRSDLRGEPAPAAGARVAAEPGAESGAKPVALGLVLRVTCKESGAPLAGAGVTLGRGAVRGAGRAPPTACDAQGRCELPVPLALGAYVRVSAAGYFPVALEMPRSRTEGDIAVELARSGSLEVVVETVQGVPVPNAHVSARPRPVAADFSDERLPLLWPEFLPEADTSGRYEIAIPSRTDAGGRVALEPLPCDTELEILVGVTGPEGKTSARIDSSSGRAAVRVIVSDQACLRGRLVWEDGTPARGVFVQPLAGESPEDSPRSGTFPDGTFLVCGLAPGFVRWRVDLAGEAVRTARLDPLGTDVGEVRLARPAQLRVRLALDARWEGAGSFLLALERDGVRRVAQRVVAGAETTIAVAAGDYVYRLLRPEGTLAEGLVRVPGPGLEWDLTGELGELCVAGLPRPEEGAPELQLWSGTGAARREARFVRELAWRGREGGGEDLVLGPLLPGTFEVHLLAPGGDATCLGPVTIPAGGAARIDARAAPSAAIEVQLVDESGAPVAAAGHVLTARPDAASVRRLRRRLATDAGGHALFSGLCPGEWSIERPGAVGMEETRVGVELGKVQHVRLRLDGTAALGGRVLLRGTALEGAGMALHSLEGRMDFYRRVTSGPLGEFELAPIAPGRYGLEVAVELEGVLRRRVEYLDVREGAQRLEIDLGDPAVELRFTRGGAPLDSVRGVWIFGTRGEAGFQPERRAGGPLLVDLGEGEHLFAVASAELPYVPDGLDESCVYCVRLEHVPPGVRELEVAIEGVEVRVVPSAPGVRLPLARLVQVGAFRHPWGQGWEPVLAYRDEPDGSRTFLDVPRGALLRLEAREGWGGEPSRTHELAVGSLARHELCWPPR